MFGAEVNRQLTTTNQFEETTSGYRAKEVRKWYLTFWL